MNPWLEQTEMTHHDGPYHDRVSSARSMSHYDPQILTEPPARIADLRTSRHWDET